MHKDKKIEIMKNDIDIGTIENLKLKSNVGDQKPVRKSYWTLPNKSIIPK